MCVSFDTSDVGRQTLAMSPNAPPIPPIPSRAIEVLAFEDVQLLDLAGATQVFAAANEIAGKTGMPTPYGLRVIAPEGGQVRSTSGLAFATLPLPTGEGLPDTLIVVGGQGVMRAADDPALVAWLRSRAAGTRRVASVCTGAFLLAAAGLLDGRRAVTHWEYCERLARLHPRVRVDPNPIFIVDDGIWTSAGVTAGIDLCLALVEEDLGRPVALAVARNLVVFLKRPGDRPSSAPRSRFRPRTTGSRTSIAGSRHISTVICRSVGWRNGRA